MHRVSNRENDLDALQHTLGLYYNAYKALNMVPSSMVQSDIQYLQMRVEKLKNA